MPAIVRFSFIARWRKLGVPIFMKGPADASKVGFLVLVIVPEELISASLACIAALASVLVLQRTV